MFTGLVEAQGTIAAVSGPAGDNPPSATATTVPRRLTIATGLGGQRAAGGGGAMRLGDSVAIDGCCLTVVACDPHQLSFEAATETLSRTTLGALAVGDSVNLERALCFGDRLGGHLVSGHIDGVGTVRLRQQRGSALYFDIEAPPEVARLTAARGSITVAGVSLTVTQVQGDTFSIGLIPHTLDHTTLGRLQAGMQVNLEADLVARYVERLLERRGPADLTPSGPGSMPVASTTRSPDDV
jgi:riboflavin synthase